MLASLLLLTLVTGWQPPPGGLTCRSVGTDPPRTWRFEKRGGQWQISHWAGVAANDVATVRLPASTDVRLTAAEIVVKGKTSNGGIDVTLTGLPAPATATLDVYVSYELEVNVDASLTPKIDELATDGPIGVRCDLT